MKYRKRNTLEKAFLVAECDSFKLHKFGDLNSVENEIGSMNE